jgi:hypothetical protein
LANTNEVDTVVAPAVAPPSVSRWPLPQARLPSRVSLKARLPPAAVPTPIAVPGVYGRIVRSLALLIALATLSSASRR